MLTYQEIVKVNISEIKESDLIESLRYYNSAYRIGEPEIEDYEYDLLIEILQKINSESVFFNTAIQDTVPNSTRKENIPIPMFSLNKEKTIADLMSWVYTCIVDKNTGLIFTPKFDGMSLAVDESNKHAWTRGDGNIGQRSDEHFYDVIDTKIKSDFYTFGEAIISKQNWTDHFVGKINPRSNKPYSSSRNTVAGLFNNNDATPELKHVDYIRYGYVGDTTLNKIDQINVLNELNVNKLEYHTITIQDLIDLHNENKLEDFLNELYNKWSIKYQIDGLVVEFNDPDIRSDLGREKNNNPKYARAIKLPNWFDIYQTTVKSIIFNVSKAGKVKPVIIIETVNVNGVNINRATAYNCKYLLNNNIAVGSVIEIVRSGDVIPKHIKTISFVKEEVDNLKYKLNVCPCCGCDLTWDGTYTELVCNNSNCREMRLNKLIHFITTLKIEEFGEKEIENLFNIGFDTYDKILGITLSELTNIDGWAEKSANKLLNQFKALKNNGVEFALLLHALDLFNGVLGYKTSKLILGNFDVSNIEVSNIPNLVKELIKIKGISDITANAFLSGYIKFYENKYDKLPINFSIDCKKIQISGDKCSGMKVCFTGIRDENLETQIIENGGEILSGVSKNTTHLIVKDLSDKSMSSSKVKSAQKLNTIILPIDEFRKLL